MSHSLGSEFLRKEQNDEERKTMTTPWPIFGAYLGTMIPNSILVHGFLAIIIKTRFLSDNVNFNAK